MDLAAIAPYVLAFREGVSVREQGGVVTLESNGRAVPVKGLPPAPLRALSAGGATSEEMAATLGGSGSGANLPVLYVYLERFASLGLLSYSARAGGGILATLEWAPAEASSRAPVLPGVANRGERYALSRFAVIRSLGGRLVVESPLGPGRVVLHGGAALAVCHSLAEPRTVAELAALHPEGPLVLGLLLGCRAAALAGPAGEPDALGMWSFHDLLFHTRSRWGRTADRVGATFRFGHRIPPLPAIKPPPSGARIELFRPDIEALQASDAPFTRVLEQRRSIRAYGEAPLSVRQIGELLYRTARVRAIGTSTQGVSYAASSRPYPGSGACYELEIYLAVRACDGLAPGLYHHDPQGHALTALPALPAAVDALLGRARVAMLAPAPPQVVLVVAARFGRVMWKYESMAYATILKDVGALFQTVYLAATAMGLASCALGCGDSDLFAGAAGLDYLAETSVGEMALGSLPP